MKRPRTGRSTKRTCYHNDLLKAIGRHLPGRGLPLIEPDRRVRWTDRMLVVAAMVMSWCQASTVGDAFEAGRDALVSMYRSRRRPGKTLTGFLSALRQRSFALVEIVVRSLRQAVVRVSGSYWRLGPWVLMGVDGSRVECPRTASNERAFGCGGRKKTTPQQWVTTIFHVASGLLWDWRRGRADAAERTHLRQMLGGLPQRTLLLADAGFTGFDLLRKIMSLGHDFIVRVGSNVRLLRKLGYRLKEHDGIVYLWPVNQRRRRPLRLRLVVVHDGRKAVYLLTSVKSEAVLTDHEIAGMYRWRWGIEVLYRSLKRTMDKHKLRSDSPKLARVELDWAMVSLWMLDLLAAEETMRPGEEPGQWSVAIALRAVRRAMRRLEVATTAGGLFGQLARATRDNYVRRRKKAARNWPHKKREQPPGAPRIRMATTTEVRQAQALGAKEAAG
jgi:hypothetical protein